MTPWRCKVPGCEDKLLLAESVNGKRLYVCCRCGVVYCLINHPLKGIWFLARYIQDEIGGEDG